LKKLINLIQNKSLFIYWSHPFSNLELKRKRKEKKKEEERDKQPKPSLVG
jgi:hypothetical protein